MSSHPPASKRLQRQNLATQLADDLRKRLLNGEFEGGTLLRQEQLAREYGVSRMPVREALQQLDSEGLLIQETHRGARVSALSRAEMDELFDLRLMIELHLLEQAIPRMTRATFRHTETVLEALNQAYAQHDISRCGSLNGAFHCALYAAAGRQIHLSMLGRVMQRVDRYLRLQITLADAMSAGAREHEELLALCRERRTEDALTLLVKHIRRTQGQLRTVLSGQTPPSQNSLR